MKNDSVDFTESIKIPRRNGTIQDGMIVKNTALKISRSKGGVYAFVRFADPQKPHELLEKHVQIMELMDTNSVDSFSIDIPQLKKSDYDFENYEHLSNELIDEIIEKYNNMMIEFMTQFFENIPEYDVTRDEENNKFILSKK